MAATGPADFNEDWEEWDPSQGNFLHHMVAGSIAGITEHTAMYPVDTFKTYVQCMRECPEAVAGRRVMEMVRGQGLLRLWRGVGTMFAGCVPAHALYFSVLEHCKVREGESRVSTTFYFEVSVLHTQSMMNVFLICVLSAAYCCTRKQRSDHT